MSILISIEYQEYLQKGMTMILGKEVEGQSQTSLIEVSITLKQFRFKQNLL